MAESKKLPSLDVALLDAPTDDGKVRVFCGPAVGAETGEVRLVKDGQRSTGARRCRSCPSGRWWCVCDVEVLTSQRHRRHPRVGASADVAKGATREGGGRPAQVATEDYRGIGIASSVVA